MRDIPDRGVHANTYYIALSDLSVEAILDQPLSAFAYFDVLHGWLKQPLSIRQQDLLRRECPDLYIENKIAKFDHRYRQRLQGLPQPSTAALEMLIDFTGDDMLLNYGEIALDLLPPDLPTLDRLFGRFQHGFVQPWHLGKQMQFFFDDGVSTRRFEPGQPKRGLWFHWYADQPCRIDDHPFCLHMQGRVQGAQLVRSRLGINRPSDLLQFDFLGFWRKRLRLYRIDFERLGRFDANRCSGSTRRKPRVEQWGPLGTVLHRVNIDRMRGGRLYHIESLDRRSDDNPQRSLQHFVDSYGRGPYLTRMPITLFMSMCTNAFESSEMPMPST
jgi:hypothetical protein